MRFVLLVQSKILLTSVSFFLYLTALSQKCLPCKIRTEDMLLYARGAGDEEFRKPCICK